MRIRFLALILFLSAGVLQISGQRAETSKSAPFVTGVDHFYVFSEKTKLESLLKVFQDDFRLPQAWSFRDYGSYKSGSVSLGNVIFEFATFEDPANKSPKTEFQGIVFEPSADAKATEAILTSRGIPHGPPDVENPGWTIIPFTELPPANAFVMLCDYRDRRSVADLYSKAAAKLQQSDGGSLGVVAAKEIVVGVTDLTNATAKWELAMGRKIGPSRRFKFAVGPDIRLVQSDAPGIKEVHIKIKSKAAAKRFLESRQMLGLENSDGITIDPAAIGNLTIRLVKN